MKIISDHFGWLYGDGKRSICNIYLFNPCWNQGSRPERRTQLIKLGYKGLPRRMDHRVTVKLDTTWHTTSTAGQSLVGINNPLGDPARSMRTNEQSQHQSIPEPPGQQPARGTSGVYRTIHGSNTGLHASTDSNRAPASRTPLGPWHRVYASTVPYFNTAPDSDGQRSACRWRLPQEDSISIRGPRGANRSSLWAAS